MNGKAFTVLNTRSFVKIFSDNGCQNTEKSVSLTGSDIRTFLETEENQCKIWNAKTESYVFRGFGNGILAAENEIAQLSQLKSPYEPFHEHFKLTWKQTQITI